MGACQYELRRIVIKPRRSPDAGRMTRLALMTEARESVNRARGPCILCLMTLIAIGIRQLIIPIDMTQLTLCCRVPSRQRKLRVAVTECRR
jgi:hypothetical protein